MASKAGFLLCRSANSNQHALVISRSISCARRILYGKADNSLLLHLSFFLFLSHTLCRASNERDHDIVVEMKTDKSNEEAGLLNKRPPTEQVRIMDTGIKRLRVMDLGFGQQ